MKHFFPNSIFLLIALLLSIFCFLFSTFFLAPQIASAATNIDFIYRYAWNDAIGWIDFYSAGNVNVSSQVITGYASSSVGYIALNCNSMPNGDCDDSNFKVFNDGSGNLSGWAWNDAIGWISFASSTAQSVYQVTIDSAGNFSGWAWNDIIGWISFSCENDHDLSVPDIQSVCDISKYKTKTNWTPTANSGNLISSIFDTQVIAGAAINTIMWQGTLNGGTVKFQIASSNNDDNDGEPWNYKGPDGADSSYYDTNPNVPAEIKLAHHNNKRYVRYRVFLAAGVRSPIIEDIIINYSP